MSGQCHGDDHECHCGQRSATATQESHGDTAFDLWASVFRYPNEDTIANLRSLGAILEETHSEAVLHLADFTRKVRKLELFEIEELWTRTFDLNPVASLDLGWHLYGETYERGSFMVAMRDYLRTEGIPESGELPDHLSHALQLLGHWDSEKRAAFLRERLFPALNKVIDALEQKPGQDSNLEVNPDSRPDSNPELNPVASKTPSPWLPLLLALRSFLNSNSPGSTLPAELDSHSHSHSHSCSHDHTTDFSDALRGGPFDV